MSAATRLPWTPFEPATLTIIVPPMTPEGPLVRLYPEGCPTNHRGKRILAAGCLV
jgi:hypothetical protein